MMKVVIITSLLIKTFHATRCFLIMPSFWVWPRVDKSSIFSPEDGKGMFLRNIRIYRRVYMAPIPPPPPPQTT
jgi:hypothetical protein